MGDLPKTVHWHGDVGPAVPGTPEECGPDCPAREVRFEVGALWTGHWHGPISEWSGRIEDLIPCAPEDCPDPNCSARNAKPGPTVTVTHVDRERGIITCATEKP